MTTTFLDKPVQGDVTKASLEKEQYGEERFGALINRIFASDRVLALSWIQYTPYFNDGEPCVFNAGPIAAAVEGEATYLYTSAYKGAEPYTRTTELWGEDELYGVELELIRPDAGPDAAKLYEYYGDAVISIGDTDAGEALNELNEDIDHYYSVLKKAFGDHAIVVAFRDHFVVETYDHD